jgi:hypothetical protein
MQGVSLLSQLSKKSLAERIVSLSFGELPKIYVIPQ